MNVALLISVMWCSIGITEEVILTTPCELMADPAAYDKKLVTVRSGVRIGFEESTFDVNCENDDYLSVWVTFAEDVEMPVIFCCGDHARKPGSSLTIEGIKLRLNKDNQFNKYFQLLTSVREKSPSGVPCFYDCYQYQVTATLTGHFFQARKPDGSEDGIQLMTGYGHFGCCSLFVIEKVEEVESHPTNIPIGSDFDCDHEEWQLPTDRSAILAQQVAVEKGILPRPDVESLGEKLIKEKMISFGDDFQDGDETSEYEGKFEQEKEATYIWLSKG
ncbi:hypothetical protein L0222_31140 [bacterium]|nr:hypothetical protein [bacterium]